MSIVDDRVLEYIHENGHGSPTEMMDKGPIRYSRAYIARRCKELSKRNLLKPVGNGVYVITDRGERYLEGELDTSKDAPENELEESNGPNSPGQSEATE